MIKMNHSIKNRLLLKSHTDSHINNSVFSIRTVSHLASGLSGRVNESQNDSLQD